MSTPLVNGVRHSWADIKVNLLGRTVTGISAISWEEKENKANNYGAGQYPVSRGRGRIEPTAKMTLHAYEVNAILKALGPGKKLIDVGMFDITVAYLEAGSDGIITHVIRNAEFLGDKRDVKSGDTHIEQEYDLICSHIEMN